MNHYSETLILTNDINKSKKQSQLWFEYEG